MFLQAGLLSLLLLLASRVLGVLRETALAAALGRIDRGEPAALNCSFQGRTLDRDWLIREIAPQLQTLARQLM